MALSAFQKSWVTWRKTSPQSALINIAAGMPRTPPAAGKNKTQHFLENKPYRVGEVRYRGHAGGCSIVFPAIPVRPCESVSWTRL